MTHFEESFTDLASLTKDWILAPGMTVQNGILTFAPGHDEGFCVGVTRRTDFLDCSISVDVRIVNAAVGLVLRHVGPGQYYMVQFDLANDPSVVWFHTFTPSADEGYRVELVPTAFAPEVGVWHGMRVDARGDTFDVFLGDPGGPLHHCASWKDPHQTYRHGAVGVWEHGGEAGEYRAFRVDELTSVDA